VEHIIRSFRAASVKNIAVITGNNAEKLENSLKDSGAVFLRNAMYEHNEMLDSIKIGLEYQKEKCDKIFITPVDVPLFASDTIKALLHCKTDAGIPTYNGKTGHPIILGNDAAAKILAYTGGVANNSSRSRPAGPAADSGNGGLRNVIAELSLEVEYIETRDQCILYDIDTQEDYSSLLELFSELPGGNKK